ncbi:MAG TPA: alpha/beta hydrolase [Tissierellia bacterium]|nr:alpha/beta hydrolase [Tissierellia bacterium]
MKRRIIIIFVLIFAFIFALTGCNDKSQNEDEANLHYIEEEYNLDVDKGKIYGTLMMPKDREGSTVALIIAGSGPTDRNGNNSSMKNNSLKMIAEALAKEGISSVRFDKRGIGESASLIEKEEDLVFEDYVNDVVGWIEKLKKDNRFNKVVVIGHSEGALIGAVAVNNTDVDGFVSIAGVGYSAYETLERQLKAQSQQVFEICKPIMDELMKGNLVDDVPEGLYSLFRPSVQPYLISWFKYDPVEEISKVEEPVLIIQGDNDIQITVEDANRLYEGNPESKLVIIEGMNHILKDAPEDREGNIATYSNPTLPLNKRFVQELINFINEL